MNNPKCPYCEREKKCREQVELDVKAAINVLNRNGCQMPYHIYSMLYDQISAIGYTPTNCAAAMKREKKRKTYAEDFKEKHPKADMLHTIPLTGRDVPNLCRAIIYGETMNCPVAGCRVCWNEEMDGEDE